MATLQMFQIKEFILLEDFLAFNSWVDLKESSEKKNDLHSPGISQINC